MESRKIFVCVHPIALGILSLVVLSFMDFHAGDVSVHAISLGISLPFVVLQKIFLRVYRPHYAAFLLGEGSSSRPAFALFAPAVLLVSLLILQYHWSSLHLIWAALALAFVWLPEYRDIFLDVRGRIVDQEKRALHRKRVVAGTVIAGLIAVLVQFYGKTVNAFGLFPFYHGIYAKYDDPGHMRLQAHYREGQLHGPYREFFDNGQLYYAVSYQWGRPHGEFQMFYQKQGLMREGFFENGVLKSWRLRHPLIPQWHIETVYQGGRRLHKELCSPWGCAVTRFFYDGDQYRGSREYDIFGLLVKEEDRDGIRRENKWCGNGNLLIHLVDFSRGETRFRRVEMDTWGDVLITHYGEGIRDKGSEPSGK